MKTVKIQEILNGIAYGLYKNDTVFQSTSNDHYDLYLYDNDLYNIEGSCVEYCNNERLLCYQIVNLIYDGVEFIVIEPGKESEK